MPNFTGYSALFFKNCMDCHYEVLMALFVLRTNTAVLKGMLFFLIWQWCYDHWLQFPYCTFSFSVTRFWNNTQKKSDVCLQTAVHFPRLTKCFCFVTLTVQSNSLSQHKLKQTPDAHSGETDCFFTPLMIIVGEKAFVYEGFFFTNRKLFLAQPTDGFTPQWSLLCAFRDSRNLIHQLCIMLTLLCDRWYNWCLLWVKNNR